MNINENMRNQRRMEKKVGVYLENFSFQLVIALELQTWYQTDAKIQTFFLLI